MTQRMPNTEQPFGIVVSDKRDWFVRSSYWLTTSRSLQRMGGKFDRAIEVNVTPINPSFEGVWEKMKEVRIRDHMTSERADRFSHELCGGTAKRLLDEVGEEFYETIVHADLLADIDQERWKTVDGWHWQGGGIPFILVCKDPSKYPHLVKHFVNVMLKDDYWAKAAPVETIGEMVKLAAGGGK